MSGSKLLEEIIERQIEKVTEESTSPLKPFVLRESSPSRLNQSLQYFAYGFDNAVRLLGGQILEHSRSRDYLHLPLFALARHSIELHIKASIEKLSEYDDLPLPTGHSLKALWKRLQEAIEVAGITTADEWSRRCSQLVDHIEESDPTGERFRYPTDKKGVPFEYSRVEVEGLLAAYWNITTYCEAVVDMVTSERGY